jgi:hypothetical protein
MKGGSKIITLIDQFDKVLELGSVQRNRDGLKYSLYSLRHTYAINALRDDLSIYTISSNMGTGTEIIKQYYGKQATPRSMATTLGGKIMYEVVDGKQVAVGSQPDEEAIKRQMDIATNMSVAEMKALYKAKHGDDVPTLGDNKNSGIKKGKTKDNIQQIQGGSTDTAKPKNVISEHRASKTSSA